MVPALLYLLFKKYVIRNWPAIHRRLSRFVFPRNFLLMMAFLLLLLLKIVSLKAQEEQLHYNVVRNGKTIGWTTLTKSSTEHNTNFRLQSHVKARLIFQFIAEAMEEAAFLDGSLVYSSQFRKMNGDVKENKSMKLTREGYEMYKGQDTERLKFSPLHNHMLCLYFEEPIQSSKVYSDSFQQLLNITKTADGGYKVNLPDGNSSSYYYKNGICTNVKIDHRFYSAEMVLSQ